jgi:hypothetical protein
VNLPLPLGLQCAFSPSHCVTSLAFVPAWPGGPSPSHWPSSVGPWSRTIYHPGPERRLPGTSPPRRRAPDSRFKFKFPPPAGGRRRGKSGTGTVTSHRRGPAAEARYVTRPKSRTTRVTQGQLGRLRVTVTVNLLSTDENLVSIECEFDSGIDTKQRQAGHITRTMISVNFSTNLKRGRRQHKHDIRRARANRKMGLTVNSRTRSAFRKHSFARRSPSHLPRATAPTIPLTATKDVLIFGAAAHSTSSSRIAFSPASSSATLSPSPSSLSIIIIIRVIIIIIMVLTSPQSMAMPTQWVKRDGVAKRRRALQGLQI